MNNREVEQTVEFVDVSIAVSCFVAQSRTESDSDSERSWRRPNGARPRMVR